MKTVKGIQSFLYRFLLQYHISFLIFVDISSSVDAFSLVLLQHQKQQQHRKHVLSTLVIGRKKEGSYFDTSFATKSTHRNRQIIWSLPHQQTQTKGEGGLTPTDEIITTTTNHNISKGKLKKKRYLWMNDVHERIRQRDRKAPKKAKEMVHRIKRLKRSPIICNSTNDNTTVIMMTEEETKKVSGTSTEEKEHNEVVVQAYNLWIHAIAKSGRINAGNLAEMVLEEMKQDTIIQPNIISYTSVIDAYARSSIKTTTNRKQKTITSAHEAERIFFDAIQESEINPEFRINSKTYDAVLNAWSQLRSIEGAKRAQTILDQMHFLQNENVKPTRHTYSTVIQAWANSGAGSDAANRAHEILQNMLILSLKSDRRNSNNNNNNNNNSAPATTKVIQPNTMVCNSVLHAWASSGNSHAGNNAEKLVYQMHQLHLKKGYDTNPDVISYNTVLSAYSHSGASDAACRAENVLKKMQSAYYSYIEQQREPQTKTATTSNNLRPPARPNTISYNTVLDAWSKSTTVPAAALRAKAILDYMIQKSSNDPSIKPDAVSFTSVLNAYAKSKVLSDKATRARELLDQLLQIYESDIKEINNYNNNESFSKKTRSRRNHQQQQQLRPTAISFNTVLNACAFSAMGTSIEQQRDAMKIAVQTFMQMRSLSYVDSPDTVSYGNMIKCCKNLMPKKNSDARNKMSIQLFQKCCTDGMVGDLVWKEIKKCVQPIHLLDDAIQRIDTRDANNNTNDDDDNHHHLMMKKTRSIPIHVLQVRDLPRHWRRNNMKGNNRKNSVRSRSLQTNKSRKEKKDAGTKKQLASASTVGIFSETSCQSGKDL